MFFVFVFYLIFTVFVFVFAFVFPQLLTLERNPSKDVEIISKLTERHLDLGLGDECF